MVGISNPRLIITVDVHAMYFGISPAAENENRRRVCVRQDLMTMSCPMDETKSVSEDIQVLQISLHRGSLSSINLE